MSVHFVTGKLGAGKTLFCVSEARRALLAGRRVATNVDLHLEHLLPASSKASVFRLPDKPRVEDLVAMGPGSDIGGYDESKFGLLLLDELATWLNSRSWSDPERGAVIDWFLHARKHLWDVYFVVQDVSAVDKQMRSALCEYLWACRDTSTLAVPVVGTLGRFFGFKVRLPRGSVATQRYSDSANQLVLDRRWYRSRDLFDAYDTRQVFSSGFEFCGGQRVDFRACYSVLSSWHLRGRYLEASRMRFAALRHVLSLVVVLFFLPFCPRRGGVFSSLRAGGLVSRSSLTR